MRGTNLSSGVWRVVPNGATTTRMGISIETLRDAACWPFGITLKK